MVQRDLRDRSRLNGISLVSLSEAKGDKKVFLDSILGQYLCQAVLFHVNFIARRFMQQPKRYFLLFTGCKHVLFCFYVANKVFLESRLFYVILLIIRIYVFSYFSALFFKSPASMGWSRGVLAFGCFAPASASNGLSDTAGIPMRS